MPAEFDLISNHHDVSMDPETENGDFQVHTHLVLLNLYNTAFLLISIVNKMFASEPISISCV